MTSLKQKQQLGMGLGLVAACIFGGTLPMTRMALTDLSPGFLTAFRCLLAAALAATYLVTTRATKPSLTQFKRLAVVALCVVAGFPGLVAWSMQSTPAAAGGIVVGILPLATAVMAVIINKEHPSPLFWVFALLGSGLVIVFAVRNGADGLSWRDSALLLAVLMAAIGYAVSGQLTKSMRGTEVISWAILLASPINAGLVALWWPDNVTSLKPQTWCAIAYLAALSQWIGFFALNKGFQLGGVSRVSQTQLLQVFMALALAHLMLGEKIDTQMGLFALAVTACVYAGSKTRMRIL